MGEIHAINRGFLIVGGGFSLVEFESRLPKALSTRFLLTGYFRWCLIHPVSRPAADHRINHLVRRLNPVQIAAHPSTKLFTLLPKAVALLAVVVSGCGTNQSSLPVAANAKAVRSAPVSTIDAGIIFLGTETYQCYSPSQEITVRFLHAVDPETGETP